MNYDFNTLGSLIGGLVGGGGLVSTIVAVVWYLS